MEGLSITKLLVIVVLVLLLFGTNKLKTLGSDLGEAIKGFKKSMADDPKVENEKATTKEQETSFIENSKNSEKD